jgi:hypothetical protein
LWLDPEYSGDDMLHRFESCTTHCRDNSRGYLYAVITAIICPCHLPLLGIYLGTSAAGAVFAQHFVLFAVLMGVLTLISFAAAARALL